jgi:hypothetical protein
MNLENGGDCCVEIISFRLGSVMNIDRIAATRNCPKILLSACE